MDRFGMWLAESPEPPASSGQEESPPEVGGGAFWRPPVFATEVVL
jgi:hypothetical protein